MQLLRSIYDVILDRSPEEVLGAIAIAVALSIVLSGVFALFRRKVEDRVLLVIALMILACVTSMGFGAGYVMAYKDRSMRSRPGEGFGPPGRSGPPGSVSRALKRADADGDGRISEGEAAEAARSFVAALQPPGIGSVDYSTLAAALLQSEIYLPFAADPPGSYGELDARVAEWLVEAADADSDHRLTMDEATAFLKRADTDGDGHLGRRELRSVMWPLSPSHSPFSPSGPMPGSHGRPRADGPSAFDMNNRPPAGPDAPRVVPDAGGRTEATAQPPAPAGP
ncbi:hypothetical protein TA3x_002321 [Tundrisphaera sp. TA3]|uniref:hypothetical protein n=1 Tax=Tundrisphaera sp. TA3 TaxID=3435775 RepID=UPI003EBAC1E5